MNYRGLLPEVGEVVVLDGYLILRLDLNTNHKFFTMTKALNLSYLPGHLFFIWSGS